MRLETPCPVSAALCRALLPAEGAVGVALPEWLLLVAPGETRGRDGRRFRLSDPAAVVAAHAAGGVDIPLDWEHATHLRAPNGQPAPAAGWIVELQARDGAVWGRVQWTAEGERTVRERAYRYYSPAYLLDAQTREVASIASVGLTNKPNLDLPALNRAPDAQHEEDDMNLASTLAALLALGKDADDEAVTNAVRTLITERDTALNRAQTPDLALYVPRADHDAALNRAAEAEQALAEARQAELNKTIDALIEAGLAQARITPATVDYHRAQAASEGGVERLRAYLDTAPAVVTRDGPSGRPPEGTPELNSEAARIAAAFGHTAETLNQYGARA